MRKLVQLGKEKERERERERARERKLTEGPGGEIGRICEHDHLAPQLRCFDFPLPLPPDFC